MRFDGYAGTIRGQEFPYVAEVLAGSLGGVAGKGKARKRYGEVIDVDLAGHLAVWVGWDVANGAVYFEGKGDSSADLARAVRVYFPEHTVSRADVCDDYDEEGAFEKLINLTRAHKGPRVKGAYVHLSDDPGDGKTWAAGVRGSPAFTRVYEAGKHPDRLHLCRPHWARVEMEARPHTPAGKQAMARMKPLEVWGTAAWTHRVAEALSGLEIPRFLLEPRPTSHDKTSLYLARTFHRHFEEWKADLGSWECIGREIEQIWAEDEETKRRWGTSQSVD